jgi:hypothetical protein
MWVKHILLAGLGAMVPLLQVKERSPLVRYYLKVQKWFIFMIFSFVSSFVKIISIFFIYQSVPVSRGFYSRKKGRKNEPKAGKTK